MPACPTFEGTPVDVLVLWLLQRWIFVEQVGYKRQVEFGVAADDISGHDELSAPEALGLIQHALGSLQVVLLLKDNEACLKVRQRNDLISGAELWLRPDQVKERCDRKSHDPRRPSDINNHYLTGITSP